LFGKRILSAAAPAGQYVMSRLRRRKAKPAAGKQSRRKEIKAAAEGKQNPQEGIPSPRQHKTIFYFIL
jgi:hypothetical protein